jgi:hypothetical protein
MGMGKDEVKRTPWSPDLTHLNFYLQGHMEAKLCAVRVSNVKHRRKQTASLCHKLRPFTWTDKNIFPFCLAWMMDILSTLIYKQINRISSWHKAKGVWYLCLFSHTFSKKNSCKHIFITLWQNLRILQFLHFILEKVGFKISILLHFLSDIRFRM